MREVICFHRPEEPNGYLSNWYCSDFVKDGIEYSSMEQYMMYQKALLFGDDEVAKQILATSDVRTVKALGRSVKNYNNTIWNGLRQIVVYQGLLEKFGQSEELKSALLATKPHFLAECAVQDKIWGIGLGMNDERRLMPDQWEGQNLLGFALMAVREALK